MKKSYLYDWAIPFIIPVLFFITSLISSEVDIKIILMLFFTSSFSVFLSYIYIHDEDYKSIHQPVYAFLGIIGVSLTLFYDTLSNDIGNMTFFKFLTFGVVLGAVFSIYYESKKEYKNYFTNKNVRDEELRNLKETIKKKNEEIKTLKLDVLVENMIREKTEFSDEEVQGLKEGIIKLDGIDQNNTISNKNIEV